MLGVFKDKLLRLWVGGLALVMTQISYADEPGSLAQVSSNILGPVSLFTKTLYSACYVLGAMLIMSSIVQYRDHRNNPSQVPISRPVSLLIFGLLLIGLPWVGHLTAGASFLGK